MDSLSKELHEFLVRLHYHPEEFDERVIHYMEHLFMLLSKDDEEAYSTILEYLDGNRCHLLIYQKGEVSHRKQ